MRISRIIFSTLLTLATIPVHAQIGELRNMLSVGGHAGAGTSQVSFVPTIRQTTSIGPEFGLAVRSTSEKYFWMICSTQLELNYAGRGWTELIEDGSGNEYTRELGYVEIPFMAHIGVGREIRGFQGFLNLGPQVSLLLSDNEIFGGRKPWDVSNRPNNVTGQYGTPIAHKFDYGITGGIGLEMRTGIGAFGLEGRYYFGLGNIYGITKSDYFVRCANSTISLRLSYMFQLW